MATPKPTDCRICNYSFDERVRAPRNLPCGHHMCTECIGKLIVKGSKICPFCRIEFFAFSVEDFPLNEGLLECVKYINQEKTKFTSSATKLNSAYQRRISEFKEGTFNANREVLAVLSELKTETQSLLDNVQLMKKSLSDDKIYVKDSILPQIDNIFIKIDRSYEKLNPFSQALKGHLVEIKEKEESLALARVNLDSALSLEDAASIVDESEQTNILVSKWAEGLKDCLLCEDNQLQENRKTVNMIRRIRTDMMNDMKTNPADEAFDPSPITRSLASQLDISKLVTPLKLWEMCLPVKRLVEQGRLFAYQPDGHRRRVAKISIENNKLLLYSLEEEMEPVNNAYYLKYDDVRSLAVSPYLIFLDLRGRGSGLGRVWMRINENANQFNLHQHFTGWRKGKTYINMPLQVANKGQLWERIIFGRHLTEATSDNWLAHTQDQAAVGPSSCGSVSILNNQSAPPLIGFNPGPYKSIRASMVGSVTEGLSILSDAVCQFEDLREVVISSCGLQLSTKNPI